MDLCKSVVEKVDLFAKDNNLPLSRYTQIGLANNMIAKINKFKAKIADEMNDISAASYKI